MQTVDKLIGKIIKSKSPCFFFSPHLDDAVLSCGSVLSYLSGRTSVTVVTVFTKPSEKPYSFSARRFLKKCNVNDADELFKKRKREDIQVMKKLGISYRHCEMIDGTWRSQFTQ